MNKMDVLMVVVLLVVLIAFLLYRTPHRRRTLKMLNKFPTPPWFPIVGCVGPFILKPRYLYVELTLERMKKYNNCYVSWVGSVPVINTALPQHAEVLLNNMKHLDKSFMYKFLHPWLGTGLLTSTGQKWHSHRKMITPTFHFKILDNFVEVFSEKSEILVNKLRKEVGSQGFDVYPYITKCALDIICETAMGTQIYAQDDRGADYVRAVYDMSEISVKRMLRPWLSIQTVFRLSQLGKRHAQCLKILHGFTNRVIAERKALMMGQVNASGSISSDEDVGKKRRKAFLDLLLEAVNEGAKLTDEEVREEVDTFMFEGHDTTSAGMCWALFLMGLHPDVQEKAYKEQESIFQGSERAPNMKDLNDMKYLERVIKETLRLYPSVPTIARKLNSDTIIDRYEIPAGCSIAMHIYNVHRNPDQFPNPENFDPDNFLPERVVNRHPYAYIPFSAGPRNCIGQKFALLEEKTVLSYILRNYRVKSLDKRDDIVLMGELILRPEKGIRLTISKRSQMCDE